MLLANVSLILKPHKDHSLPQNFCPISVINDLKIFGRLLEDRLALVITTLVSPDQTGFIPRRQITDNILLVTNIIQDANLHSKQVLLLSLDIHKALDSSSWSYLDQLLPRFGITGDFLQGFHALYQDPQTRIKLPGNNSQFFPLKKGTRQGCPLSPLLFASAIEPLSREISENINIKGYCKGPSEFKLSLYPDNVLLFLTNLLIALPNLTSLLESFYTLSGLGVNLAKCSAMPINIPHDLTTSLQHHFSFAFCTQAFRYL